MYMLDFFSSFLGLITLGFIFFGFVFWRIFETRGRLNFLNWIFVSSFFVFSAIFGTVSLKEISGSEYNDLAVEMLYSKSEKVKKVARKYFEDGSIAFWEKRELLNLMKSASDFDRGQFANFIKPNQ